ncbi:FAD-binding oxidoreductase [Demequina mangrovi]|uniref:FAD binding domain-containing protein n=1 Tax=Demequina mangrovi TaxID=1043493 RepID=A0A1H6UJA9_9MICO|nr:FAD-binding oxidoreductase [Demequina mangrovi]SEI89847.1 FAD binding domain-containing protein [Demequina mangrovi]
MSLSTDAPDLPEPALTTLSNPRRTTLASGVVGTALSAALDELTLLLDGDLVRPADPDWDAARAAWQLGVDQRPVAVVLARSESDVARTMRLATRLGLRVAPQSSGHGAVALGDLDGAILLRTSALASVTLDVSARTVTVGAGATWGDVADAAAPHGLAGLAGSSRTVGVVGYCLGGGLGWLGRLHGLGAGSILAARVVLPGGAVVIASPSEHADLWWALRGGGGAGVVTELTLRLVEVPELVAGSLWWPHERAAEVLKAWARLLPSLPREITTVARVLRFPDIADLPPHLRGARMVLVQVAAVGTAAFADRLLAPLRALDPVMDDLAEAGPEALGHLAMDPPDPSAGAAEGLLLRSLDDSAIDAWIAALDSAPCAGVVAADLRQLGGALDPSAGSDAALTGLAGAVAAVAVAPVTPVADLDAAGTMVGLALGALAPWTGAQQYANFVEHPVDEESLVGTAHDRLDTIRMSYDPDGTVLRRHGAAR